LIESGRWEADECARHLLTFGDPYALDAMLAYYGQGTDRSTFYSREHWQRECDRLARELTSFIDQIPAGGADFLARLRDIGKFSLRPRWPSVVRDAARRAIRRIHTTGVEWKPG